MKHRLGEGGALLRIRLLETKLGTPLLLALLGALWLAYVFGSLDLTPVINSEGYVRTSRADLLSLRFFESPRPFVTALMYKIYGSSQEASVVGQLVFSTLAWLTLTFVLAGLIEHKILRLIHCLVLWLLVVWWNITGWNFVLRSESTSFSFLALWLAALVFYLRAPGRLRLALLIISSFFFCFTRDSVPLVVVPTTFVILLGELLTKNRQRVRVALAGGAAGAAVLTLALQVESTGHVHDKYLETRYEFPLLNVMMQRILPDAERTEWFERRGMPVHREVLRWKKRWASGNDWAFFRKQRYEELLQWVRHEGKYTYLSYLLSHPGYTLESSFRARSDLFPSDLTEYTKPAPDRLPFSIARATFPLFEASFVGLLALVGLVRWWLRPVSVLVPVASFMTLFVFFHAIMVFHLDAMEVRRHSLLNLPWLHLAAYVGFLGWFAGERTPTWHRTDWLGWLVARYRARSVGSHETQKPDPTSKAG